MDFTVTQTIHSGIAFYGIKYVCDGVEKRLDDISTDKNAVTELCVKLKRGKVTEITLMDIIQDFME